MARGYPNNIIEEFNRQISGTKKPPKKRFFLAIIVVILVIILTTIVGYFFTPLQEPINNIVLKTIYGEPEINVYITRNYFIWNL
ncbi:MAG: hypothetical protein Q8R04_02325, partial [Nanoarchaeota archaeon]|nr:hypothetical protein [Nanoarchaeota archaeon]